MTITRWMRSDMSSPVLDDVPLGHFTPICYDGGRREAHAPRPAPRAAGRLSPLRPRAVRAGQHSCRRPLAALVVWRGRRTRPRLADHRRPLAHAGGVACSARPRTGERTRRAVGGAAPPRGPAPRALDGEAGAGVTVS